ncbi:MAG: asparagine synthase-related protein, partial [Nitrososphaera sp.]|nr:asparagine synthase-related protein [Nitrososphaera sp.]
MLLEGCQELTSRLAASVARNRADALLLSGGLDSSILASILRPSYSVTAALGGNAPDLAFARQVAKKYSSRHVEVVFSNEKMLDLVEQLVQVFETFDPIEIRNSAVALAGMEQAKSDGHSIIMTGDGGDEIFAGYSYLQRYYSDPEKLDAELRRLWDIMHFSSEKLGRYLGVSVKSPFLDGQFMSYAKSLGTGVKVGERDGQKWGKFALRRCYEAELGLIAWRPKLAQEQGAATDKFQDYLSERIDDGTFANKARIAQAEGVRLRSKEHLHYYAIFRSHFAPPKELDAELRCP